MEGVGGVSPGVRKVLGGHHEGAPGGPEAGRGGRGCSCVNVGSIGLEHVAAFRALGELSPHPSVTPCPLLGTLSGPQEAPALRGASRPRRGEVGQRGGQQGARRAGELRGRSP